MTARHRRGGRAGRVVVWAAGLAVAAGSAVATAHGLFEVALAARVPASIAWLYPLITDGLALVAYTATARLAGPAARYAWSVVVLAAGLSGLAQAAYLASDPTAATLTAPASLRFGVGAWPAVAAAVAAHLLYLLLVDSADTQAADARTVEAAPAADEHVLPSGPPPWPPLDPAPAVQPESSMPAAEHPVRTTGVQPVQPARTADVQVDHGARAECGAGPDDGDPVVHPSAVGSPRERAHTAAAAHAARAGELPTVSELQTAAEVSRGTAAAVLRALRQRPAPLHLVTRTPDNDSREHHQP